MCCGSTPLWICPMQPAMKRILITILLSISLLLNAAGTQAQSNSLAQRIQTIMDRPEFKHALFGIQF